MVRARLQYEYDLSVYHAPGTHWYHAHRHGSVAKQTENGMAGALISDEPPGQEIIKRVQEKVIIIQDITNILVEKTGTGQEMLMDVFNSPAAVDAALAAKKRGELEKADLIHTTVNGVYQPTLRMNPGEIQRWRVINAGSNTRAFNELFVRRAESDRGQNLNFFVVARNGVTLKEIEPVEVGTSLFMGPGNRVDLARHGHPAAARLRQVPQPVSGNHRLRGSPIQFLRLVRAALPYPESRGRRHDDPGQRKARRVTVAAPCTCC